MTDPDNGREPSGLIHTFAIQNNIFLEEWKECRESVRTYDNITTHTRSQAILVSIALMAIGGSLTIIDAERGLIIEFLALAFLVAEYYIERQYKGYLGAAVKRAKALETKLIPPDSPKVDLGKGRTTNEMISGVLTVQSRQVYGFLVGQAHHFFYLLLYIADGGLIVYSSYRLGPTVNVEIPLWILALVSLAGSVTALVVAAALGFRKARPERPK